MKDRHSVFNTSHCIGLSSCSNCIASGYLKESLNRAYCIDSKIDFDLTECYNSVFIRLTCLKKRKQLYLLYSPYLPRNIQGFVGLLVEVPPPAMFFSLFFFCLFVLGLGLLFFLIWWGFLKYFQETPLSKKIKIQPPTLWKEPLAGWNTAGAELHCHVYTIDYEYFHSELCLSKLLAFYALVGSAPHHCEHFRITASTFMPFSSGADTPALIP